MAWEVKRHEGYWLGQQWVRSRFGDQLIVEFATIKCLMFRPYTRKEIFSAEILGGHHAQPECGIGQCPMMAS
jgi:hypothetical protein